MQQTNVPAGSRAPQRRPGTFRVGSIGGVDILVTSSWLLIALLIAVMLAPQVEIVQPGLGPLRYVAGLAFAVALYLSVLLHEVSHALMAQRYGLPVRSITLHFLGGATEIEGEPDTPGREFGVSVVGPLTSLAVGGLFVLLLLVVPDGLLRFVVYGLAATNLVVGVLNLVPGLPLDGGRVLKAAVWHVTGNPHRGTLVAGWGGRVAAVLVFVFPIAREAVTGSRTVFSDLLFSFVIALFLWTGASAAIASARLRRKLPSLQARRLARRALSVSRDVPLAEAVRQAQQEEAGGIVVIAPDGRPEGIVNEAAVLATPEERKPWVSVHSVARSVEAGLMLPADLSGESLVRAMQRTPATEYLLVEPDGSLFGLLSAQDVDRAFAAAA